MLETHSSLTTGGRAVPLFGKHDEGKIKRCHCFVNQIYRKSHHLLIDHIKIQGFPGHFQTWRDDGVLQVSHLLPLTGGIYSYLGSSCAQTSRL